MGIRIVSYHSPTISLGNPMLPMRTPGLENQLINCRNAGLRCFDTGVKHLLCWWLAVFCLTADGYLGVDFTCPNSVVGRLFETPNFGGFGGRSPTSTMDTIRSIQCAETPPTSLHPL